MVFIVDENDLVPARQDTGHGDSREVQRFRCLGTSGGAG